MLMRQLLRLWKKIIYRRTLMKLCLKIDISWENPFNFWNENVKVIRRLMQKTTQSWKIHIPTSQRVITVCCVRNTRESKLQNIDDLKKNQSHSKGQKSQKVQKNKWVNLTHDRSRPINKNQLQKRLIPAHEINVWCMGIGQAYGCSIIIKGLCLKRKTYTWMHSFDRYQFSDRQWTNIVTRWRNITLK